MCHLRAHVRGRFRLGLAAAAAVLIVGGAAPAALDAPSEYQVKAACLCRFGNYVEWPEGAFPDADSPFTIGILGKDPFGPALEKTAEGKNIGGRRIVTRRFQRVDEVRACHILFISRSERGRLAQILERLGRSRTLTVSETDQFLQRGGMINFIIESKRVGFEINPDAAERAGLRISSRLLELARIVRPGRR